MGRVLVRSPLSYVNTNTVISRKPLPRGYCLAEQGFAIDAFLPTDAAELALVVYDELALPPAPVRLGGHKPSAADSDPLEGHQPPSSSSSLSSLQALGSWTT